MKNMQCIIRLDDIAPDMNWGNFNNVKIILERYNVKPLIGIVPDNQDPKLHFEDKKPDFVQIIRELQDKGWIVAQHGTYHRYVTNDSGILKINKFSEFAGMPYEEQLKKITMGQQILKDQGINTDIFMAPGHTFDRYTLLALKQCGFHTVTDGLYHKPYWYKGLLFVPCRMIGNYRIKGIDTVCLHPNLMEEEDFKELETFCQKNKDNIIPFHSVELQKDAVSRNLFVIMDEKLFLWKRRVKNDITHSKRLAWYLSYTNHDNKKIKLLKRIIYIPILLTNKYRNQI